MFKKIGIIFEWSSKNGAFVLTFISIIGAMILALYKESDVNSLLPTLLGIYITGASGRAISAHINASKDEKCNTAEVIREIEGTSQKINS